MTSHRARWLVVASLIVGCSSAPQNNAGGDMAPAVMRPAGFNPPPLEAGEIEYDSPIIRGIAPGTDVTYCSYLDAHIVDESDILHFRVWQSMPGHHAVVYAARQERPVDTHVCNEDDMTNVRFVAGGGAESIGTITIPEGLAFRIPANSQLMIQTHWINATSHTADGQAVAYLTQQPASPSRQVLDLFNVINASFTLPAGKTTSSSSTCTLKQDMQLFTLTGHQHEWGTHVSIDLVDDTTGTTSLWSRDWQTSYQSAPPYNIYGVDKPLQLKAGQTIKVTCTWNNTSADDLAFPREMCIATSFYFPANGEIDCVDGNWGG